MSHPGSTWAAPPPGTLRVFYWALPGPGSHMAGLRVGASLEVEEPPLTSRAAGPACLLLPPACLHAHRPSRLLSCAGALSSCRRPGRSPWTGRSTPPTTCTRGACAPW